MKDATQDTTWLTDIDYSKLIDDKIFTFTVGPEKAIFRVHVSILSRISEPLARMMSNGSMKESLEGEAVLEGVEPEVFAHLLKFAYQGVCAISDGVGMSVVDEVAAVPNSIASRCHHCVALVTGPRVEPFCSEACRKAFNYYVSFAVSLKAHCIVHDCGATIDKGDPQKPFCPKHSHMSIESVMNGVPKKPKFDNKVANHDFTLRQYGCSSMTHDALKRHIELHQNPAVHSWPLVRHAKVYALANMYMVKDLPELTLHKLHRSLIAFEISETTISEVIELLLFTYENTEDTGDISSGTADKLRDLVMAYVQQQSSDLIKHNELARIIGAGGAFTIDFFKLVCR